LSDWPDELIEKITQMWKDGSSAGEIAAAVGDGRSRNSIIGKLTRLGVMGGSRPHKAKTFNFKNPQTPKLPTQVKPTPVPAAVQPVSREDGALVTLDNIGPRECRYSHGEIGTPGFRFCANKTDENASWCPYHHTVVFVKSPPRRYFGRIR
jgi:GcrA cell cycle regulator